jgi:hypothetical protein
MEYEGTLTEEGWGNYHQFHCQISRSAKHPLIYVSVNLCIKIIYDLYELTDQKKRNDLNVYNI